MAEEQGGRDLSQMFYSMPPAPVTRPLPSQVVLIVGFYEQQPYMMGSVPDMNSQQLQCNLDWQYCLVATCVNGMLFVRREIWDGNGAIDSLLGYLSLTDMELISFDSKNNQRTCLTVDTTVVAMKGAMITIMVDGMILRDSRVRLQNLNNIAATMSVTPIQKMIHSKQSDTRQRSVY